MTALSEMNEVELFSEYKRTGSRELREEIVRRYVYIAEIIAKRFMKTNRMYNNGIEYDDLYQVACVGLICAADRLIPKKA